MVRDESGGKTSTRFVSNIQRGRQAASQCLSAMQVLDMDDKKEILVRLVGDALDLVADQNGNHVIQKCIECIEPASALNPLVSVRLSTPVPRLWGHLTFDDSVVAWQ